MDRIFLDANVLFSAAYKPESRLLKLWHLKQVELISSQYALEEARRNLENTEQQKRLQTLTQSLQIVQGCPVGFAIPARINLPEKDQPILLAALIAKANYLLTGDITHFGKLFGKQVGCLKVMLPGEYLRIRK